MKRLRRRKVQVQSQKSQNDEVYLKKAWGERDVKYLAKYLFPGVKAAQHLTLYQSIIVRKIAFSEVKRFSISAYTRYGKTQIVAIAVAMYILINENKKIKFIGPKVEQAGLIREYLTELIVCCPELLEIAELDSRGRDRLKKEASRNRLTFKNGCEYRVISAHGKGFAAMGHGGDLIIIDESAMISRESYAKIVRLLGDDPVNSMLVEMFNPWDRDTVAFDHSISNRFERIEIGWKIGIKEDRITKEFVEEMREELTPMEFIVLYESKFPEESEDSLHNLSKIEKAEKIRFNLNDQLKTIIRQLAQAHKMPEDRVKELKTEIARYRRIISCDPADMGMDLTVIKWGVSYDNQKYELEGIYSEPKSDPMEIVGKVMEIVRTFVGTKVQGLVNYDGIGIGTGSVSRTKEILKEKGYKNVRVNNCKYGENKQMTKAEKSLYRINKAKYNFRLKELFLEEYISFSRIRKHQEYRKLKSQLLSMKWKRSSAEKREIIDPEKSPDYNDAMVYFIWPPEGHLNYTFL